ncbi:MAG: toll/interleukin-1 receptor domain-containing protein [Candidatus Lokiarchaeota archaeon]|nr:toll/interleukin-1 receptor domain-containing protein [Candidatus Lokiarchaeota archaeon]
MGHIIFMSYVTEDANQFRIPQLARELERYSIIEKVLFWQQDTKYDIVEYMDYGIENCDVFLLFCSSLTKSSDSVKMEWKAALMKQKHIIPVFIEKNYIPALLSSKLGVKFSSHDLESVAEEIVEIIKRPQTALSSSFVEPDSSYQEYTPKSTSFPKTSEIEHYEETRRFLIDRARNSLDSRCEECGRIISDIVNVGYQRYKQGSWEKMLQGLGGYMHVLGMRICPECIGKKIRQDPELEHRVIAKLKNL